MLLGVQAEARAQDGTPVEGSAERVAFDPAGGAARAEGVRLLLAGDDPIEVLAPRSTWRLREGVAAFSGGVTLLRGELRLTCERLEVERGPDGLLGRALAEGEVRIARPPWRASAARAELLPAPPRVVLTGSPRVEEDTQRMEGRRIVLDLDAEEVRCEDCRLLLHPEASGAGG